MSDQLSGQGKEIGSVLIAVNSYTQPGTNLPPLPQADQVLSDYIKTFHEILFFKVTWLFDYTLDAFWSECHEFFKNAVGDHVAVVLYGHGGIDDKIERLRTKSDPLQIHILEHTFAQKCPKKNRYLFLDLCRERDTVAPAVYQADTEGTFIVRSTLSFHEAQHNLWSPKMAKHLCNHANLSDVIRSVDDEIMRETPSFRQASDEQAKGTSGTPNFRELANFANMEFKTRALTQNLDDAIQNAKKDMDAYRALASGSEQTKNLKVCDNPHIQSLKRRIMNRYMILKPSESRVRVEYVQIALLKSQPYRHKDEEEILILGGKKLDFLESFRSCGLKSGKVCGFIDGADLLQPTSDPDNRIKVVYGQAGIGKTTLLTHICRSLAMDRMKSSYHLVLYFPLRDKVVSSAKTLSDLLSYYASAKSLSAVEQAVEDSDDKEVLFIFDGANEVQDLLSSKERGVVQDLLEGKALPQADVIVSSRPGGLAHLMKQKVPVFYEIHGLSKLSIEQYIKEFFKSYPEKGERLWKELQSRDDLMGGAHIPMTLLIFCNIFGKEGLPPTLTDCHKQFIVEVHNRESPVKKWKHFDQCPKDLKQLLHSLGRLAYNGLMFTPSTFVFVEEEVEEAFKTTSLDKSTFKGLLHEHPSISEVYGNNSTFNFSNTTQQELFSAYYISCLPVENQIEFLRNYMSQPKFSMVVRFYAGLTRLADEQVLHTVLHEAGFFNGHPFLQKASATDQSICALDNLVCSNDDPGLLRLFHFLYESQNFELTQVVARHLDGKSIRFSLFLTSYDTRVIAHCLSKNHSFSHLCFYQETTDSDHVLPRFCLSSILMSDSVVRIQKLTLLLDRFTLTSAFHLKEGLARTAVEKMVLSVDYIDMLVVAAIFEAPWLKSVSLSVHECRGARDDGDSDLQVAQLFARNTSIKKLVVRSPPSFLLPVVKGLGANTCVVKLHLHSTDGDGSVGQALATASTANTTLKDITLLNVSPFPLMEVLSSREVALDKLQIQNTSPCKGPNPYRLESLDTLAQNIKVKRLEAHMNFWTAGQCKAFADGLSRNKFLQEVELTVPKDVMDYVSAKMSNLRATTIKPGVLRKMGPRITSKLDFAQFLDHFLPNLLLLSDVLGIKNQATDILNDKSNATEKCLNILDIWLKITDSPTWKLFCSILQRYYTFNYVRSLIKDSLYAEVAGEDRFKEDYLKAVEAHGCIELTITKCSTIGPPRTGKTCLKHLLTNTPWDVSQDMPSTEAIRAPEWVECFRGEANSLDRQWTTFSRKHRIQALFCSIASKNYEPSEPNSNDSVAEHDSPSENTRGQILTTEPAESTISTVPAVPESIPDRSALVPEEQMDTSPLNHSAFLASEAATPKSDPTASEEYKLLNSELSSLIPDKLPEDKEKKGQTLHKMQILHFIDTGGQSVYHDVHPVLITSPSVYLVVFNLMECFSGMKSKDDFLSSDLTQKALRSICTLSSKEPHWGDRHFKYRPEQPKIFLTGTHLDVLTTNISDASSLDKVLAEIHEYIQNKMVGMPYRNYFMYDTNGRCFWAVNNLQAGKETDKYLKDLRQLIVEESMTMHVKLPITWFILEHIAASCSCHGKPLFEYNNIFQMAIDRQLVADKEEFDALLHVFHILGLFFVPDDDAPGSTKTYIFTDPNLLYSLTSHLLSNLKMSKNLRHTRDAIQEAIRNVIDKMVEDKQLKEAVSIDPDWFISLLCQLRLMAQLGEDGTSDCIIPAILPKKSVQFENPSVISLLLTYYIPHSEFSFVPSGLFCALIADIIRPKPSMASSVWEPQQLYRCQVVFKVDFGKVCIQENHTNIQFDVRFESRIQEEGLSAEQQYCNRLREDLCERLVAISGSLYQQSKSDFDAVAMWGIPCQYHKNERDPSHLAVCYKIPQTDLYCATCMGDPAQTEAPFQILRSDRDIVWFADL